MSWCIVISFQFNFLFLVIFDCTLIILSFYTCPSFYYIFDNFLNLLMSFLLNVCNQVVFEAVVFIKASSGFGTSGLITVGTLSGVCSTLFIRLFQNHELGYFRSIISH